MQTIEVHDYIRPLIAYRNDGSGFYPDGRFAGSCFFIDDVGTAITCSHIIESLSKGEELFTYDIKTRQNVKITVLHTHETDDFAIIKIPENKNKHFNIRVDSIVLGKNIMSYGFLNGGIGNSEIKIDFRVMKGCVSRLDSNCTQHRSSQIIETSFPSLAGFSGAPIFCEDTLDLIGMLFGNVESSIEVFAFKEVSGNGNETFKESVNRICELGLAHTTNALVSYIDEFKSITKKSS